MIRPCREATEAALSERLPAYGFSAEPRRFSNGYFYRWWLRESSWRADVVELVFRRGADLFLSFNLIVYLPAVMPLEPGIGFDSRGLLTPELPHWFWRRRVRRYGHRVCRAVEKELSWFDDRDTPEKCLTMLRERKNNGPRGGELWQAMHEHLDALVE